MKQNKTILCRVKTCKIVVVRLTYHQSFFFGNKMEINLSFNVKHMVLSEEHDVVTDVFE